MYSDILRVLMKISLILISFPSIPHNFRKNEILRFRGDRKELVFFPTHFIHFYLNF